MSDTRRVSLDARMRGRAKSNSVLQGWLVTSMPSRSVEKLGKKARSIDIAQRSTYLPIQVQLLKLAS